MPMVIKTRDGHLEVGIIYLQESVRLQYLATYRIVITTTTLRILATVCGEETTLFVLNLRHLRFMEIKIVEAGDMNKGGFGEWILEIVSTIE